MIGVAILIFVLKYYDVGFVQIQSVKQLSFKQKLSYFFYQFCKTKIAKQKKMT